MGYVRLSTHFSAREFRTHDGTVPPDAWLYWARKLCVQYLEPLRSSYGPVSVVSGYRHPSYNARIGGAPESYHQRLSGRRGAACDVRCARGAPADWAKLLDELGIPGLGLYPSWVHADNRLQRARW